MPTIDWLKKEFHYGYSSGDVTSIEADTHRISEEQKIGGSYKDVFEQLLKKHIKPNHNVLELGPGGGSWSRAILSILGKKGSLTTIDFQDVSKWIDPNEFDTAVKHFQTTDINYTFLKDAYHDIFWSFGVLCHNNIDNIYQILSSVYPRLKNGALLIHQYSDWEKLERYGWENGAIPLEFKSKKDSDIWWSRNNQKTMQTILESIGYEVLSIDVGLVKRDSIFLARKP